MKIILARLPIVLGLAALALGVGACAAGNAYRKGESEAKKGNWDLAVGRFTLAADKDPSNIQYKMTLAQARVEASRFHAKEAQKRVAAEELEKAVEELEIAARYDPSNRSVADDLKIVKDRIAERDEDKKRRSGIEAMKARASAIRIPTPLLSPRSPVPITLKFADQSLQKILDSLGKLAGVNIVYDSDFRDKKASVDISNVTFEEALNQITLVNGFFCKVLDENTVIVAQESAAKHKKYDDYVLRTFYLENSEAADVLAVVKGVVPIQRAIANKNLNAITVIGSPDKVALAEKVIETNDKARGEVLVDVQVLEVNRSLLKQYGLKLSNYELQGSFAPTGPPDSSGQTSVRANFLSSLNVADWVVTVPSTVIMDLLQTDSGAKIIASPRLRAAEGKKTSLKIGQQIPIPVTTFTAAQTAGTGTFAPATSFTYKDVGVTLELTPTVSISGDVALEMNAEFSTVGADQNVGTTSNPLNVPTFLSRSLQGVLRIKDGETSLIGGLIQTSDQDTITGLPGFESIPLLNRLFVSHSKQRDEEEVLLSITPHVVRAPKVTQRDLEPFFVGTEEAPKVQKSLFGEPEAEPSPAPSPAQGQAPAAAGPSTAAPVAPAAVTPARSVAAPPPPLGPPPFTPSQTAGAPPVGGTPGPVAPSPGTGAAPAPQGRVKAIFSPAELQLKAGEVASVSLVGLGVVSALSVDLLVNYDPAALEVSEVSSGSLLTLDGAAVQAERDLGPGVVHAKYIRGTPATGSGAVATLQIRALKPGTAFVSAQSLEFATASGQEHPALPPPCRIEVTQ